MEGVKMGKSPNNYWIVNSTEIDMTCSSRPDPVHVNIKTESQSLKFDILRTALIIVDMQNDFCEEGGWAQVYERNVSNLRNPIEPLKKLISPLRRSGVKIIWLNWGCRRDYADLHPSQFWIYNSKGDPNIRECRGSNGLTTILEENSWAADIVKDLKSEVSEEDFHVKKFRPSGFSSGTQLESILRNFDIKTIFFAGVNTDQCVLTTITDASFLGYGCIMLRDCCSTMSPDFVEEAAVWQMSNMLGFVSHSENVIEAITRIEINENNSDETNEKNEKII